MASHPGSRATPEEITSATAFLAKQTQLSGDRVSGAAEMIRGLSNINEFLYVD